MSEQADSVSEYAARNQADWNTRADQYQAEHGDSLAEHGGLTWSGWSVPEAELQVLGEVAALDVLEFGCGAAQWSIGLARKGARMVALDLSERQLEHARRAMTAAGLDFPLVHASAESVPLPDESFDVVFCDHGALSFADPYRTVPEAARLLRPGGLLAFSHMSPLSELCWPDGAEDPDESLHRDYFSLHRLDPDDGVTYNLPYGGWIRLFRANGLEVLDLIEPRPAADATSSYWGARTHAWARRWPVECIWRLRKR
ncbi:class I SAM-dependent methyltransferase [Streptomyces triticagri]|uniref:Class I SAM-dependent methyltransferase n=1 Tax=Streptomyces triticagri TaxID=2293568 RepID=A0A372M578_9ACTN|nr:class I SAM-dependent methyltransferase [Streptomyces triticagri]RFU86088.1 class I SAM-dependent methyltransferase [Streptomyces triticagri]